MPRCPTSSPPSRSSTRRRSSSASPQPPPNTRRTHAQKPLIGNGRVVAQLFRCTRGIPGTFGSTIGGSCREHSRPRETAMPRFATPQHRPERRPRATRQRRHDRQLPMAAPAPLPTVAVVGKEPPAIRRGSFLEHARQFPEVYHAPAAQVTVSATPCTALPRPPGPPRTPRAWLATARCFLTARRIA